MTIIESVKIALLKRKARCLRRFMECLENDASCGHTLLRHISRDYSDAADEFEATLQRLRELDPKYPRPRSLQ